MKGKEVVCYTSGTVQAAGSWRRIGPRGARHTSAGQSPRDIAGCARQTEGTARQGVGVGRTHADELTCARRETIEVGGSGSGCVG